MRNKIKHYLSLTSWFDCTCNMHVPTFFQFFREVVSVWRICAFLLSNIKLVQLNLMKSYERAPHQQPGKCLSKVSLLVNTLRLNGCGTWQLGCQLCGFVRPFFCIICGHTGLYGFLSYTNESMRFYESINVYDIHVQRGPPKSLPRCPRISICGHNVRGFPILRGLCCIVFCHALAQFQMLQFVKVCRKTTTNCADRRCLRGKTQ